MDETIKTTVQKLPTPFYEGTAPRWTYYVTVEKGDNWEYAYLDGTIPDAQLDGVIKAMEHRVLNSPVCLKRRHIPMINPLRL
jgi:hypothetical protein